jgi:hypothetical protein
VPLTEKKNLRNLVGNRKSRLLAVTNFLKEESEI